VNESRRVGTLAGKEWTSEAAEGRSLRVGAAQIIVRASAAATP
jgi:hypothetical protein